MSVPRLLVVVTASLSIGSAASAQIDRRDLRGGVVSAGDFAELLWRGSPCEPANAPS